MIIIKNVLDRLTFPKLVSLADQSARQAEADARLERIRAEQARKARQEALRQQQERREIRRLGYPEYLFLKNAQRKAERYRKQLAFEAALRERIKKRRREHE